MYRYFSKPINKVTTMKKISLILFFNLFLFSITNCQDRLKYNALAEEARMLFVNKEYLKAGHKFSEAFITLGGKGTVIDRHFAACAWALANELDSAFIQLFKIANNKKHSKILKSMATMSDFNSLHNDERWIILSEIVKSNIIEIEANLDQHLVAVLDTVYIEDQKYRQQLYGIEKKYGLESEEVKEHWKVINNRDSINLIKVKKILDEHGWLGVDIVGDQGNRTLFLVIQHADIKTQEQYLPMMREAAKNGNAISSDLALLEDRVALRNGEKQIYGSQIGRDQTTGEYYVLPLIDPDNVDIRRAEVGLGLIKDYVSRWEIIWNVEEYKNKLPEYESKQQ